MGSFVQLCLLPELWSLKCQKWLILCTLHCIQQNIRSSSGKILKCICKVLFGPFRKYYGLRTSELPLIKLQLLEMQDFGIPLFTQKFLCLPAISHEQISPKPINRTIFCNNSTQYLLFVLKMYFPNCDKLFAVISSIYKKIVTFDILKTIGMRVNMIARQMTPFFSYTP